jgi:hypothetical protein
MNLVSAEAAPALNQNQLGTVLGWMALLFLGSGLLVVIFRLAMEGTPKRQRKDTASDKTLIRSWLAIALAGGLLFFAAASFLIGDASLRNLLMGGVVASTGSVIAFYFSSKASEQTQQNLLNAAFGTATINVPDVKGRSVGDARTIIEAVQLNFATDPTTATDDQTVADTKPPTGTSVKPGDTVTATITP